MIKRFAQVVWWLGALWGAVCIAGAIFCVVANESGAAWGVMNCTIALVVLTGLLWGVAFILGGSFIRPPR